ncbi:MAG: tRNA (guanosine(37)-N1)-methyltransferase TrmD [Planctomycetes bacterium]|nr:tRNA (guanosine(37)-N1)-methyltransferase TrmD [Planctomycetota bacterium]
MRIDVLTIFPRMFDGILGESIIKRAIEARIVDVRMTDFRAFAKDRHRSVDDRPYGGGPGMVLRPEPIFDAVEAIRATGGPEPPRGVLMTPQGRRLDQALLRDLARGRWLILVCGHYEGFDERIRIGLGYEEVSIGDYVLSGGEIPAMVLIDGIVRLLPGALGDPGSSASESFSHGTLEYPQYTRPAEFRGMRVPEILISGDHGRIAAWRREQGIARTQARRRDLLDGEEGAGDGREERGSGEPRQTG